MFVVNDIGRRHPSLYSVKGHRQYKAVAWGWRQDLKTTVEQTLMRGLITVARRSG